MSSTSTVQLSGRTTTDESVLAALTSHPSPSIVSVSNAGKVTDTAAASLSRVANEEWETDPPPLSTLILTGTRIGPPGFSLLSRIPLSSLTHLDLSWSSRLDDSGLASLSAASPPLKRLLLAGSRITDASCPPIADSFPTLTHLDLSAVRALSDDGLAALASGLTRLRILALRALKAVSDDGIALLLRANRSLNTLDVAGVSTLTDGLAGTIKMYNATRMARISFDGCPGIGDQTLSHLAAGPGKTLRAVNVSGARGVTDAGLETLAGAAPRLEEIALGMCPNVTDGGIQALAGRVKRLSSVSLTSLKSITDDSLLALGPHPLTVLNAFGVASFTDAGLAALTTTKLQELNLYGSEDLSESALLRVVESNPGLTDVDLGKCDGTTDDVIQALVDSAGPLLTSLRVANTLITDQALAALSGSTPALTALDISRTDVSEDGIIDALSAHPSLSELILTSCDIIDPDHLKSTLLLASPIELVILGP